MKQAVGQLSVIRHQEQSLRVQIQPSHRPHPCRTAGHQVGHRLPPLLIRQSGHIAPGLVEHEIGPLSPRPQAPSVHLHVVPVQVRPVPQVGLLPVDGNPAGGNPLLRRPPGGQAAGGNQFLQPLFHARPLPSLLLNRAAVRSASPTAAPTRWGYGDSSPHPSRPPGESAASPPRSPGTPPRPERSPAPPAR